MIISIIIPAYNEVKTIEILLNDVINYQFLDYKIKKEIIVVDSNSSDGTREILEKFFKENKIILIKEDKALGKGHTVRNGLKRISGDIILIQDADLEYEVKDYQKLIDPIIQKNKFVLGTRHSSINPFKMREMVKSPTSAFFLNLGHLLLQSFFNILYNQKFNRHFYNV